MAHPNKLSELAKQQGETVSDMMVRLFREHGSVSGVANALNVSKQAVYRYINNPDNDVERVCKLVIKPKRREISIAAHQDGSNA